TDWRRCYRLLEDPAAHEDLLAREGESLRVAFVMGEGLCRGDISVVRRDSEGVRDHIPERFLQFVLQYVREKSNGSRVHVRGRVRHGGDNRGRWELMALVL